MIMKHNYIMWWTKNLSITLATELLRTSIALFDAITRKPCHFPLARVQMLEADKMSPENTETEMFVVEKKFVYLGQQFELTVKWVGHDNEMLRAQMEIV